MKQLNRINWLWRENGVELTIVLDGMPLRVFIPLGQVSIAFGEEFRAVGCPLARRVGSARTVGGFFSSIKKAYKSVTRKAKSLAPKVIRRAIHKVEKAAETVARPVIAAHMWGFNAAKRVVKSDAFAYGLTAAAFAVPVLAPAAAAVHTARQLMKHYETGVRAAKAVAGGFRSPAAGNALRQGLAAKNGLIGMVRLAQGGDPRAQQIAGALRQFAPR
jgi:hypothetical protein